MDRVSPATMVKSLPEIARVEPPLSVYLEAMLEEITARFCEGLHTDRSCVPCYHRLQSLEFG